MIKLVINLVMISALIGCQTVNWAEADIIETSIEAAHRSAENKARDRYRNPHETLTFFGVTDTMKVVEIWPGGGWYTEILAPMLRDKGKLYAAHFSVDSEVPYYKKSLAKFQQKLQQDPATYGQVEVTVLQPPKQVEIAPAGSIDRVLTFRNVHNWMKAGTADDVFAAMHRALRRGGILGVVEHRAAPGSVQDPKALSGYVTEQAVIDLAKKAGFYLIEKSELNANAKDTRDHPKGVWTLPPSLRLKDQDRQKYMVIGESDRMTLKFIKP